MKAINRQLAAPFISRVRNGTNETCFGAHRRKRLLPGNRVSFLAENMNGLNACDPVTAIGGTLVVLLSLMIYDGRPSKGRTSLNPVLSRPYICVSCKIAHFTSTWRTPSTVQEALLFLFSIAIDTPLLKIPLVFFSGETLTTRGERRKMYNRSCVP